MDFVGKEKRNDCCSQTTKEVIIFLLLFLSFFLRLYLLFEFTFNTRSHLCQIQSRVPKDEWENEAVEKRLDFFSSFCFRWYFVEKASLFPSLPSSSFFLIPSYIFTSSPILRHQHDFLLLILLRNLPSQSRSLTMFVISSHDMKEEEKRQERWRSSQVWYDESLQEDRTRKSEILFNLRDRHEKESRRRRRRRRRRQMRKEMLRDKKRRKERYGIHG